jgi:hypothetical protein
MDIRKKIHFFISFPLRIQYGIYFGGNPGNGNDQGFPDAFWRGMTFFLFKDKKLPPLPVF